MYDQTNKGGRIAKTASDYFGITSVRDANFRDLKRRFGSVGVDIYLLILQLMAQSSFFLYPLNPVNLRRIQEEDLVNPEEFDAVVKYCVEELKILDKPLYDNGYLFSVSFVRTFNLAGLFRHRKYTAVHVLNAANHFRPGHPPLTLEDTLEMIAQGNLPAGNMPDNSMQDADEDKPTPPKKDNNNDDNIPLLGENELPF